MLSAVRTAAGTAGLNVFENRPETGASSPNPAFFYDVISPAQGRSSLRLEEKGEHGSLAKPCSRKV